jgi:hypothetical protein
VRLAAHRQGRFCVRVIACPAPARTQPGIGVCRHVPLPPVHRVVELEALGAGEATPLGVDDHATTYANIRPSQIPLYRWIRLAEGVAQHLDLPAEADTAVEPIMDGPVG